MTELDQCVANAFASEGKQEDVNKLYTCLLRTSLYVPISQEKPEDPEEAFTPLFMEVGENYFLMAFDHLTRLEAWAGDLFQQMDYVILTGRDLVRSLGNRVILALNYDTQYYKEFAVDEIARLKTVVAKLDEFAKKSG